MTGKLPRGFYSGRKKLPRNFYTQPTLAVAKNLLGKLVVRKWHGKEIIGKIVETEAYIGPRDKAAHSYNWRKTKRNEVEYLSGGRIYIYLVYGMYWQFNVTTGFGGQPECVLIRALEPISPRVLSVRSFMRRRMRGGLNILSKSKLKIVPSGPGKLCQYLKLDKSFYGEDLTKSRKIWLIDVGEKVKKSDVVVAMHVGIDYAQEWASKPWRFYIRDNPFVSKKMK